jgi:hypothetical protein
MIAISACRGGRCAASAAVLREAKRAWISERRHNSDGLEGGSLDGGAPQGAALSAPH